MRLNQKFLVWHLCFSMCVFLSLIFQIGSCASQDGPTQQSGPVDPQVLYPSKSEKQSKHDQPALREISLSSLGSILEDSCALVAIPPCGESLWSILAELSTVFKDDHNIFIGIFRDTTTATDGLTTVDDDVSTNQASINISGSSFTDKIAWKSAYLKQVDQMNANTKLAFYLREPRDRSCLLMPQKTKFQAEPYSGRVIVETLVQFLNERCGAFRTSEGTLTPAGMFHEHIMKNLYTLGKMVEDCKRINVTQTANFFQEFIFRSRPVVIANAIRDWPAMTKWSSKYLRELYGEKEIHIKLTEDGNFEGVESAKDWTEYHENWIPESVKEQLPFPDLVVVRPATAEMKFSEFLDFISMRNVSLYSAYLEYSSIPYYMPQLEGDIHELPFLKRYLERRHLNMWLSDGDTLGKLHFDPYDNFLCQVIHSMAKLHIMHGRNVDECCFCIIY